MAGFIMIISQIRSMDFFQKLTKAFWVSRPLFWIGPFAAYKAGLWAADIQTGPFQWLELFLIAFPLSLLIYGLNDIYDIRYDWKNPRKEKPVWGARISEKDVPWLKNWCCASAAIMMLTALSTLNPLHAALAAAGIFLAYAYSSPPFRLKERPILDSLSAMGYGLFAFGLAYSLSGSADFLDWRFLLLCLSLSAFHAISTVMDMGEDKKMGVRTFAAALGGRAAALFAAAVFLANAALVFSYSSIAPTMALIGEASFLFAASLSLFLAARPTPENGRLAFKLLIAYGMLWGYILLIHYFLNGKHLFQDEFIRAVPQILGSR